jgi:hypothetical protein
LGLRLLELVFFCFKRGPYRADKEVHSGSKKSRYAASNKISKATELLNHGLRERAKARTEMKMAGIDAHNRMLENKPITIERAGTSYS